MCEQVYTGRRDRSVLLTDGGEQEAEEEEAADEEMADEEEEPEDETEETKETEDEEEEEEDYEEEEGTNVLHLDLQPLFLALLGLEVDLQQVVLDIRAVPGEGNLLGNLLSQVTGLLDDGLGGLLGGGDLLGGDGILSNLSERITGWVRDQLGQFVEALPLQEIATNVINDLAQEFIESTETSTENGGETNGE